MFYFTQFSFQQIFLCFYFRELIFRIHSKLNLSILVIRRHRILRAPDVEAMHSPPIHPSEDHRHLFYLQDDGTFGGPLCNRVSVQRWTYYDEPVDEFSGEDARSSRF